MKRMYFFLALFFTCALSNAQDLKFALLTDLHVVPNSANDSTLRLIVKEINLSSNQFVVVTGDLTNQGSDLELKNIKSILDKLSIPYYIVSGNHETTWSESGCQTFISLWGKDRFSFVRDSLLFIGFPCGPYMKMGDGFIKYEDIQWVKQTVAQQLKPGMKIINFAHYPLDESVSNFSMITSFLKDNRAAVSFCGHGHKIQLMNFSGIPGIMGRANASHDGKSFGYNVVSIRKDSLFLFEKIVGEDPVKRIAISMDKNSLDGIKSSQDQPKLGSFSHVSQIYQDNASLFNGIAPSQRKVILGNSLGELKAVDPKTGNVLWVKSLGGSIYAKPTLATKKVLVVGTSGGVLVGINPKDGRELWKVSSPRIFAGEPSIEDAYIYAASSTEFLKVNAATGEVVWRNALPKSYSQGKPVVAENKVIFGTWDTNLYCLDKSSGKLLWSWNNGKKAELLSPGNVKVVVVKGTVFLVAPDRFMTALDLQTGKQLWRSNEYKVRESMGVSEDESAIYAKTMDGQLIAVEPSKDSFKLKWMVDLGIGYEHNPCPIVAYKGTIYLGSRKGEVVAVDERSHILKFIEKVGYSSVNSFEVDSYGDIWFSLIEGSVFKVN